MLGRRAAGVSGSCYLLRRRPRERADPGLVAKSDVVNRIKTEEERKPAAWSSSSGGGGVRSSCNVPEAPGGLSAEPWSRLPSSPPRRLLSGRVSVSPSPNTVSWPTFPSPLFFPEVPQALADCGGCGSAGLLLGLRGSPAGLAGGSAPGETLCCRARVSRRRVRQTACNLAFSAGSQSPGLAGK